MTKREMIVRRIQEMPEPMLDEIMAFLEQMESGRPEESEPALRLSETALRKDWLLPEEDEAWKDL